MTPPDYESAREIISKAIVEVQKCKGIGVPEVMVLLSKAIYTISMMVIEDSASKANLTEEGFQAIRGLAEKAYYAVWDVYEADPRNSLTPMEFVGSCTKVVYDVMIDWRARYEASRTE